MAMPTAAEHFIDALSSFKSHLTSFDHLYNVVHRPKRLVDGSCYRRRDASQASPADHPVKSCRILPRDSRRDGP
jgi:hypothetical protein